MKKLLLIVLLSLITFSACQTNGNGPTYAGSEGIRLGIEHGSPPTQFYYFTPNSITNDDNVFDIIVNVKNKGASWAKGGIYITGPTPNFIRIEDQIPPVSPIDACAYAGFANVDGTWVFDFSCEFGNGFLDDNGNWFGSTNVGKVLRTVGIGDESDSAWMSIADSIDVYAGQTNGNGQFAMNLDLVSSDYINRGKMLIITSEYPSSPIDFDKNGVGWEYTLQGDSRDYPGGEEEYHDFPVSIIDFPLGRDELTQDFLITNCYLYSTYASPDICIDPVPFSEGKKICHEEVIQQPSSQGAPVSLTIKDVRNSRKTVVFTIEARNVGRGDVFSFGSAEYCSPFAPRRVLPTDKNLLFLAMVRVNNQRVICNSDQIRLDPNTKSGQVTCTLHHDGLYTTTSGTTAVVAIEAWYGYRETEERRVRIIRGD